MKWFKVAVFCALIGGPICVAIWFIIKEARHRGRMDVYDRISKHFQNIDEEDG